MQSQLERKIERFSRQKQRNGTPSHLNNTAPLTSPQAQFMRQTNGFQQQSQSVTQAIMAQHHPGLAGKHTQKTF